MYLYGNIAILRLTPEVYIYFFKLKLVAIHTDIGVNSTVFIGPDRCE